MPAPRITTATHKLESFPPTHLLSVPVRFSQLQFNLFVNYLNIQLQLCEAFNWLQSAGIHPEVSVFWKTIPTLRPAHKFVQPNQPRRPIKFWLIFNLIWFAVGGRRDRQGARVVALTFKPNKSIYNFDGRLQLEPELDWFISIRFDWWFADCL